MYHQFCKREFTITGERGQKIDVRETTDRRSKGFLQKDNSMAPNLFLMIRYPLVTF